jgi:hypothetical protein
VLSYTSRQTTHSEFNIEFFKAIDPTDAGLTCEIRRSA